MFLHAVLTGDVISLLEADTWWQNDLNPGQSWFVTCETIPADFQAGSFETNQSGLKTLILS